MTKSYMKGNFTPENTWISGVGKTGEISSKKDSGIEILGLGNGLDFISENYGERDLDEKIDDDYKNVMGNDDEEPRIARIEDENMNLKERLFLMEREILYIQGRLLFLSPDVMEKYMEKEDCDKEQNFNLKERLYLLEWEMGALNLMLEFLMGQEKDSEQCQLMNPQSGLRTVDGEWSEPTASVATPLAGTGTITTCAGTATTGTAAADVDESQPTPTTAYDESELQMSPSPDGPTEGEGKEFGRGIDTLHVGGDVANSFDDTNVGYGGTYRPPSLNELEQQNRVKVKRFFSKKNCNNKDNMAKEEEYVEYVVVEKSMNHDLTNLHKTLPNFCTADGTEDDENIYIVGLEEENMVLKKRLFVIESNMADLYRRFEELDG